MAILGVPISTIWTQFFPPRGRLGEANLPSQAGRVFVVTGGTTGLGFVLARILYAAGGKVYMLTRSKERAEDAISKIKAVCQGTGKQVGSLEFIHMDLMDFATVKASAEEVLQREGPDGRLDVLFNNAGTGGRQNAPSGRQGYEYHLTTNSLGTYLLSRLLMPLLAKTAQRSPRGSVRVVWPCSILVELNAPKTGFRPEWIEDPLCAKDYNYVELYSASKVGSWFLASEFARRHQDETGVLHIAGNPGSYNTNMWQYSPWYIYILSWPVLRNVKHGADTYLWMGLSDSVTLEDAASGRYAMCDGRWHPGQREDLVLALRGKGEGGSGRAAEFYDWCARATNDFLASD